MAWLCGDTVGLIDGDGHGFYPKSLTTPCLEGRVAWQWLPKTVLVGSSMSAVPRPEDAGVARRGRSCNSSSPPLNLPEELVWKFQPIFKGYFHSSEIYQGRRVIFTARSNCRLPWQRAGRNAIKHPSVIVNTKGTTGTEKKGNCHRGRKATPWCARQDPTQ